MYYQQQLQQERRENEAQAFEQFKNSFKNDFPIRYVALHCTFMAILNVTLISTQITQIICESYMANLSIGIWSGVTNIITTYTAFILSKNKHILKFIFLPLNQSILCENF